MRAEDVRVCMADVFRELASIDWWVDNARMGGYWVSGARTVSRGEEAAGACVDEGGWSSVVMGPCHGNQ